MATQKNSFLPTSKLEVHKFNAKTHFYSTSSVKDAPNLQMKFKLSADGWELYTQLFQKTFEFCQSGCQIPELEVSAFLKKEMLPLRDFYEKKYGSQKDLVLIARELIEQSAFRWNYSVSSGGHIGYSYTYYSYTGDDLACNYEKILERNYEALNM